jgi:hypothetical protein
MKQVELTIGESQLPVARRGAGRLPTYHYDPEIVAEILARYAGSTDTIDQVLAGIAGAPSYDVWYKWLISNDELHKDYTRAKQAKADFLAEQTITLADDATGDAELAYNAKGEVYAKMSGTNIRRAEVMIKARQWAASKFHPKGYGDSLDVTSGGQPLPAPVLNQVTIDQRVQTIMQLAAARREASDLLE